MRTLIGLIVVVWLVIGAIAAGQRGYFGDQKDIKNCNQTATTVVTVLAGPLNYVGANPKISCDVPQPSK
jgi:hypothetical protein